MLSKNRSCPFDGPAFAPVIASAGSIRAAVAMAAAVTVTLAHSYTSVGSFTITVRATDKDGGTGTSTANHAVIYAFTGFFQPIDNLPVLNELTAGAAVPVKFALAGNQGLNILAAGYPKSELIACDSSVPVDGIEETVTAGSSSLSFDAATGRYIYVWKTDKM